MVRVLSMAMKKTKKWKMGRRRLELKNTHIFLQNSGKYNLLSTSAVTVCVCVCVCVIVLIDATVLKLTLQWLEQ